MQRAYLSREISRLEQLLLGNGGAREISGSAFAVKKIRTRRRNIVDHCETRMDEMPTEKVKRGNEGLASRKDRRGFLGGCSRSCLVRR